MATGDKSSKTEKPTAKRIREAREKGQIARSQDLVTWAAMLAATVLLQLTVHRGGPAGAEMLRSMGEAIENPDTGGATRFAANAMWTAATIVAPFLLGMLAIVVAMSAGQVGLKPSTKRLKPDFKRLNPLKGIQRLANVTTWWETGKAIVKTAVLIMVAWPAATKTMHMFTTEAGDSVDELAALTATTAITVLRNVSLAGLAIAALDYLWQKRKLTRDLSMTKQEVREEYKLQEGNPQVRSAIRSRQAAMSRNRMIGMVARSDVVVVNPTHYAVALKYAPDKGAPEVVAKGAGAIAARMRTEAAKHDVPVVHEPVLTRALFKACEVGDVIPLALYEAVAHLLAFVFGLRARGRAHGFHELPRPVAVA
ncbi:MAG: EscU/YscU/HrcU family type III secretion system export apparatus switch protein [Actinomycetota bacterium]